MEQEPSKEATLKEVLAEVSLTDIGGMLKGGLKFIGCWGVFLVVVILITNVTEAAAFSDFGVPDWVWWVLLAWFFTYAATSERSYRKLELSWYFPKQGWFGSLLLAAYLVGFIYLLIWVMNMEVGVERGIAFFAVWFGYTAPFVAFTAVTSFGHAKLMEKRGSREMAAGA